MTVDKRYDVKTDGWRPRSAHDTEGRQGRKHDTDVSILRMLMLRVNRCKGEDRPPHTGAFRV